MRFEDLVQLPEDDLPLLEASLLIAKEEYPRLDIPATVRRVDQLAAAMPGRPGVQTLNRYFFRDLGFHGNRDDYYDPRNSFVNDVLERRVGIPISLSTIYIEIARRVGLPAHGIGFPGHYLVRCRKSIVDCFSGRILNRAACEALLSSMFQENLMFTPKLLEPCPKRQTLLRMLNNLKGIFLQRQEFARALRFIEMAWPLDPDALEQLRDRGMVLVQLGEPGRALEDFAAYLERAPKAPDAKLVSDQAALARRMLAQFN